MRKYRLILLLMLVAPVTAYTADNKGNHAIWGVGNKSCISYTKARQVDDYSPFKNYLLGYLTAYNLAASDTYRISGNMNLNKILLWFDDYCELKSVNAFEHAIVDFVVEHQDTRKKKARSSSAGR